MSSTWGERIKISLFGESHGKAIGIVIDGLPAGELIDFDKINLQIFRRKPKSNNLTTPRKESDIPQIVSGILNGRTTGTPLCAVIKNEDAKLGDYLKNKFKLRPGHADFTSIVHYGGFADLSGGGHLSGRLTAPLVFAGTICREILEKKGIFIGAHLSSVGDITDKPFDKVNIDAKTLTYLSGKTFPVLSDEISLKMQNKILEVKNNSDSIGATIECAVVGMPVGIGYPIFDSIESKISSIVFSVPGVKGLEFGRGFGSSLMQGSYHNDIFTLQNGEIKTKTNNSGGILGGISNGMPIVFKVAFKPTASIKKEQDTVNFKTKTKCKIICSSRHDPCIAVRATPVIESVTAIALLDLMIPNLKRNNI